MSRVRLDCYKRDNRTKWERENNIIDLRTHAKTTSNFKTKRFLNPHILRKPEAIFTNPDYFDISKRLPERKSVKPLPAHLKFPQHTSFQRYKTTPIHWSVCLSTTPTSGIKDNNLDDAVEALLSLSEELIIVD